MRYLVPFFLVACGSPPRTVSIAAHDETVAPAVAKTLLACTIVGTGERHREGEEPFPFRVYESDDANEPLFVIGRPEMAHVTWSRFPARAGRGRARVGIGGQAHVRYEGFADLYGRTFTATVRMDSVDGHLWAHAGSPIDMMSASNDGEIFASVPTPFRAPHTIVVHGNCANVIYEPNVPQRVAKARKITAVSDAPAIRLFAAPASARAFTTITPSSPMLLEIAERKDDFVRVLGDEEHIGFDAWVLASDVREVSGGGRVGSGHRTIDPAVRAEGVKTGRVARDTPLYASVDEPALAAAGAFVERGAVIVYDPAQGTTAGGRELVPFEFESRFIVAPEGKRFWIAKDVLSSAP